MARTPKPAKVQVEKPSDEVVATKRRAQTFANLNFTSVPVVERNGQVMMLTITDRQPTDTLVAIIHPK